MSTGRPLRAQYGFTLLEVMVALVVVSIGLLGLAKTQAVAMANTQISSVRSLLSFQAGSLAASMHGNRAFWAAGSTAVAFTTSAATVSDTAHVLDTAPAASACSSSGTCTPARLAAYDVQQWASQLNQRFPNATASVACTQATATAPVSCTIAVSWAEKYLALNAAAAASTPALLATQTLTLQVAP